MTGGSLAQLSQRSVAITGASTGIGRAVALRMDRLGWQVFAGVRKDADGRSLQAEASNRLVPLKIDVVDGSSIAAAAKEVGEVVGGNGLDGLVNNAGISIQGPLEYIDIDDLRHQLEVNVVGQLAVTQAFLPLIRAARGRIVFMSSVAGRGPAVPLIGPYTASKYALEAIAETLRQELIPWGIKVSIIEPGSIATPLWEKGQAAAQAAIDRMPETFQERYGAVVDRAQRIAGKMEERGVSPERVAEKVEHALVARRPRIHYLIGIDAYVRTFVEPSMPKPLRDRVVGKVMGRERQT